MSLLAMPLVVANLGAEMVYILDQRLKAQCIADDKAKKVLDDVVKSWVDNHFIEELFKPQEVYTVASTRTVMERLAHSSIMRLNTTSMDKLYDLVVMGFKYQLLCCCQAQQLLQVTLTHLQTVKTLISDQGIMDSVDLLEARTLSLYEPLSHGQWALLRQTLCAFLQDKRIKVSLFLQEGIQTPGGRIVLPQPVSDGSTPVVGTLRRFTDDGTLASESVLDVPATCGDPTDFFQHPSPLGANLYDRDRQKVLPGQHLTVATVPSIPAETSSLPSAPPLQASTPEPPPARLGSLPQNPQQAGKAGSGVRELNLLAALVKPQAAAATNFRLALFDNDTSEPDVLDAAGPLQTHSAQQMQIFGRAGKNEEYSRTSGLASVLADISLGPTAKGGVAPGDDGDNLLDLMDSIA